MSESTAERKLAAERRHKDWSPLRYSIEYVLKWVFNQATPLVMALGAACVAAYVAFHFATAYIDLLLQNQLVPKQPSYWQECINYRRDRDFGALDETKR